MSDGRSSRLQRAQKKLVDADPITNNSYRLSGNLQWMSNSDGSNSPSGTYSINVPAYYHQNANFVLSGYQAYPFDVNGGEVFPAKITEVSQDSDAAVVTLTIEVQNTSQSTSDDVPWPLEMLIMFVLDYADSEQTERLPVGRDGGRAI